MSKELQYLRNLDGKLWEEKEGYTRYASFTTPKLYKYRERTDGLVLTRSQWKKVKKIFNKHDLMAAMWPTDSHFSIKLSIYKPAEPLYPHVKPTPEKLLELHCKHMPKEMIEDVKGYDPMFEQWFTIMSGFSHSDSNVNQLKWHGIEGAKDRERYRY